MSKHSPADAELIAQATALGCLPPTYTRDRHPGFFERWANHALDVVASRFMPRALSEAVAAADTFSGQPFAAEALAA